MPSKYDVGAEHDFVAGKLYRIELEKRAIVLFRRGEQFFALRDVCPHQGARLSAGRLQGTTQPCLPGTPIIYDREDEIVVCPWHGWEFDAETGCSLADPRKARVRRYLAVVVRDRVIVDLG